jgi:hypothetical protein
MNNERTSLVGSLLASILLLAQALSTSARAEAPDFERHIAPILVTRCLECHNEREAAGKLVLDSHDGLAKGGESGDRAIVAGKPNASQLVERVTAGEMPPKKKGTPQKLPADEIEQLRAWIAAGAVWPKDRKLDLYERTSASRGGRDWWSLQPVQRPQPPTVTQAHRVRNPIDAFILASLEKADLQPAPPAKPGRLIRRLYYDMIGLPPTAKQIEAFAREPSDAAYEKLVDQLLDSPQYGERWARYWLDVVRFAETSGYERDQVKPNAWKYRDWVVQALNDDKPYDQFIVEQLAGDELADRTEQSVIGTGFLRLGTWNDEPNDPHEYKYERLEDMVHSTATAFLGMTVKCARCHDHKFDPIPQTDYYRLASAFWAGPIEPRDRGLLGGPNENELGVKNVLGWTDLGPAPKPLHLLKKGNPAHPGPVIEPGHLTMLTSLKRPFAIPPGGAKTSYRRLQVARWIADPKNPLTPRVMSNRLWLHHFGKGLVRTPNNFGFKGDRPTHPELLDWLADEFVRSGWRLNHMHKLMLMSATYRQSSLHPHYDDYAERDYDNRLWWRAERRRLDAEALRDSILSASGQLDTRVGGPSFKPTINPEALEGLSRKAKAWQASPAAEQRRRSLYIFTQRSLLPPLMTTFDFADTTLPCGRRDVTTVAPQALALLNNDFVHQQSTALANRILTLAGGNTEQRVALAWQLALGRIPHKAELQLATNHLAAQRERFANPDSTSDQAAWRKTTELSVKDGLTLHLRADLGVETDNDARVELWQDQSGAHHARQPTLDLRPAIAANVIGGRPALRFDGKRRFLHIEGQLLNSQPCTIIVVASDIATTNNHREIISNWNGAGGNSTSSLFLGLTGKNGVRFSDNFALAGQIVSPRQPFVLTAVNGTSGTTVYQSSTVLAARGAALAKRNLKTKWVVGQQGNINGEYWHGNIAEILVYDRELPMAERQLVWGYLMNRYGINRPLSTKVNPDVLALASLCHVLFNSNEFLCID